MTFDRRVYIATLPEMRLVYFERRGSYGEVQAAWDEVNEWRVQNRPALGRIDIAAVGWYMQSEPGDEVGEVILRAGVPVRSDYQVQSPAQVAFFPARRFAYCSADDPEEYGEAFLRVGEHLDAQGLLAGMDWPEAVEVHRYHFNLEQHPADCGYLLPGEVEMGGGHDRPLPIAPRG